MSFTIPLVVTLAACGGAEKPTAAPAPAAVAPSCETVHVRFVDTTDHANPASLLGAHPEAEIYALADRATARAAVASCHDDRWSADAIRCFAAPPPAAEEARCGGTLTPTQLASLRERTDAEVGRDETLYVQRGPLEPWTDLATDTGVPECDAYAAAANQLMHCAQAAEEVRNAAGVNARTLIKAVEDVKPNATPEVIGAETAGCRQALDSLHQIASSVGCP